MSEVIEKEVQKENKMGTMPINKLLLTMSVPIMLSMLVQALYNIVDSIFVAQISEDALTAVSLAFPVQSLMIALASGTGVGVNALLSRALGEKEFGKANKAALHGVFLAAVSYVVFLILGLFFAKLFYLAQTTDPEIVSYGADYLGVVACCSFGFFAQVIFERLLQATGRATYSMVTQMLGALINLVLDPILIFGLFGIPAMGVKGAAIATVAGQIGAGLIGFILNICINKEISFKFKGFRPEGRMVKEIYKVGVPSIIMQSIGSVMIFCLNKILIGFSSTATAVLGVYFKLNSFIFMPVVGLNNGLVPIVAYNYGARNKDRLVRTYKLSLLYAVVIMILGAIIFETIPDKLFALFDASEDMLDMGVIALRTIALHLPIAAFTIISGSLFQALGNAVYSMITSICRQLLVLLPVAWLLSLIGNVNYVWWAFLVAEFVAAIISAFFYKKIYKDVIKPIGK